MSDGIWHPGALSATLEELAERVGSWPLQPIENKELIGFSLPRDPPDPLKSRGRDTY